MQNADPTTGKPRGCLACRAMKVKCDRTFPHCERCQKRKKQCPGYVGEATVTFRSMNRFAETQVKARTTAGRKRDPASGSGVLVVRGDLPLAQPRKSSIPLGMSTDWRAVAVPRFFEDHGRVTHPKRDISINFLQQVVIENGTESYLTDALQAVALASLANQTGQAWLDVEARQAYGKAIHAAAIVLYSPPQAKNDALLATTLLFGYFEMLFTKPTFGFWDYMHERGRISLLQLRGDDQFQSLTGMRMFGMAYMQNIVRCILMNLEPPNEFEEWIVHFTSRTEFRGVGSFNLRNARLCVKAQALFETPCRGDEWVLQMMQVIKSGLKLDNDYQSWSHELSMIPDYKIKQVKPTVQTRGSYPIYVYDDLHVAFIWDNFRFVRIHLLEVLKRCDALLRAHYSAMNIKYENNGIEEDVNTTIQCMISDICSTIPYFVGEVDSQGNLIKWPRMLPLAGHMATWSIYVAMVSSQHDSEIESWLRSKLELISNATGVRLASRLASRERKNPWDLR